MANKKKTLKIKNVSKPKAKKKKPVDKPVDKVNKGGRPTKYTKAIGDKICLFIAEGLSLREICRKEDMPIRRSVHRWLLDNEEFCHQYRCARDVQAENFFDELADISDDGSNDWVERATKNGDVYTVVDNECVNRSKLRIQTRQWILERMKPKKFGNKIGIDHSGRVAVAKVTMEELMKMDETELNKLAFEHLQEFSKSGSTEGA